MDDRAAATQLIDLAIEAIALLAFGQQDPLKTRWDNRDERASAGATIPS